MLQQLPKNLSERGLGSDGLPTLFALTATRRDNGELLLTDQKLHRWSMIQLAKGRLCGACGKPLGKNCILLAPARDGDLIKRKAFIYPPFHDDCATFFIVNYLYPRILGHIAAFRAVTGELKPAFVDITENVVQFTAPAIEPFVYVTELCEGRIVVGLPDPATAPGLGLSEHVGTPSIIQGPPSQ